MKFLCFTVTVLYSLVSIGCAIGYWPILVRRYSSDNRIKKIHKQCGINTIITQHIFSVTLNLLHGLALIVTFNIYYVRLKICFENSAYFVTKRITIFVYVTIMYVVLYVHTLQTRL